MFLKYSGIAFISGCLFWIVLSGCQHKTDTSAETSTANFPDSLERPQADSLYWSYKNGPVSPDYQRKWEVIMQGDSAFGKIWNLDRIIWSKQVAVSQDNMRTFLLSLGQCKLEPLAQQDSPPCVGYGSHQLSFFQRGVTLQGESFQCGDRRGGSVQGEIQQAARLFIHLVPEMESAVDTSFGGNSGI